MELPEPDLRIVAITDLQGTLAPCGCTSRPLGGIDRMAHFVSGAGDDILFIAAGNLLAGGPHHGGAESEETNGWKSETVAAILGDHGVHAVGGPADRECGVNLDVPLFGGASSALVDVNGISLGLVALRGAAELEGLADVVAQVRRDGARVVVVLADGNRRFHRNAAGVEGVDFVLQGGLDVEEPSAPGEAGGWLLHAGRQGQRVLVLDLYLGEEDSPFVNLSAWNIEVDGARLDAEVADLEERLGAWAEDGRSEEELAPQRARLAALIAEREALAAPALPEGGRAFSARIVELDPDMERSPDVQTRLAALDLRVNDHNREAYADRTPPATDEGAPHYVGSAACASCHASAYSWWQGHPHGRAYATLEAANKEFHLDCVGCHVTGYERPGGSTVTHNLEGALTNVGCENCHGPGSLHVEDPSAHDLERETQESTCTGCHNEEHSDLFNYDVYRQTLLVPGHGRPETP